ncbi:uncharacterized protein M6B38_331620 [Iris pallida]|uniref:Uncharacterized protein n=1 Tax=Iris pallida TaxID=29817 RepID=A0AAX6H4A3_IRIPA|nr:uncharacterized protein M6B38_331620 [Iris pallida]
MKLTYSTPILKPFLFLFFLSLLLSFQLNLNTIKPPPPPITTTTTTTSSSSHQQQLLKIRSGYTSYEEYIKHQLNKTLNPRLRHLWATRDWDRKVRVFSSFFSALKSERLLSNSSKALCVGAASGRRSPRCAPSASSTPSASTSSLPSLVAEGDFHRQPFADGTFDFEFSNGSTTRSIRRGSWGDREDAAPGGVCVLHLALERRGDKYSANDLFGVEGVLALFRDSELVRVGKVDGFGLDTELVTRKKKKT